MAGHFYNPHMPALSYASAGVDYGPLDAFKVACQRAAATTVDALAGHGLAEPAGVRGESAYLIETPTEYLAHVEEGLGTKNLIADAMLGLTGRSYYANVGVDTVATIVNDLVTVGALPVSVAMHAAVGDSSWFGRGTAAADLARGFADGCRAAGAVWGGGETPTLRGMIDPGTIVLAGSAVGRITPKSNRIVGDVTHGDKIVLLASSGVQTNGLTLCRLIAEQLPQGYQTPFGGRTYGEALLDPSAIYVSFIAGCQRAGLRLHYAAHITGHGWRKLMRLADPFVYRIDRLPDRPLGVFNLIGAAGRVDVREMYATFNMGAGFAAYVAPSDAEQCVAVARAAGHDAWVAGTVHRDGDRKAVEIVPLGITFEADTLAVR